MTFVMVATARAGSTATAALHAARTALGDVEHRTTATPDPRDAALDALDGRTLVVAGGDGSLHLAVARLHARRELVDTRIALLPLGNGQGAGGFSGGGTPLLPHAEPDDGLLDVVVSQAAGPMARVRYGAASGPSSPVLGRSSGRLARRLVRWRASRGSTWRSGR